MTVLTQLRSLDARSLARLRRPRRISVLGATGSIGESTLDLIGRDPSAFEVVALTGGRNVARLASLAIKHGAQLAVIADAACYAELCAALAGTGIQVGAGREALVEAASRPADWVMAAIVGTAGLEPLRVTSRTPAIQGAPPGVYSQRWIVAAHSRGLPVS